MTLIRSIWQRNRWLVLALGAVVIVIGGFAALRRVNSKPLVPTAQVQRGEFVDYLELRGRLKAIRSISVNAPSDAEDLQILKLAHTGSHVKKGDVVVQFDATKLEQELAQDRSALKAAEAEIGQTQAQGKLAQEQDRTDLLKAGFDVDSAKLDASKGEIVSKIEGDEAKLAVTDSQSKLDQATQKVKSDVAGAAADIEGKKQKYDKALFDVRLAEHRIAALTLRSPLDGVVTVLTNWRAGNEFVFGGGREFKEGDRAWPGAGILEIPDLTTLRLDVRADETDRARIATGQTASIHVDAVPDREFTGRLVEISTMATVDFGSGWPFSRNFEVEVGVDQADERLRPGINATARLAVDRVPDAVLVPPEAVFQKAGESVAYVLRGSHFEERPIEVGRRSESNLLISQGLKPGERVALKDPTEKP
ncbi:MAG TPA: efflux RND transporter periplasmic adaptor subunit [Terriglobia bacterium]|jgi:RND family efflux transporter MFP subunit|nr:efflux RND transporter periplasmic adaptor subunit [Terriglobia bacterium]